MPAPGSLPPRKQKPYRERKKRARKGEGDARCGAANRQHRDPAKKLLVIKRIEELRTLGSAKSQQNPDSFFQYKRSSP